MEDHPDVGINEHAGKYNWIPDFVYGGIDGAVTTFAVVAGVEGASLSLHIILILGFANLFADGFSMALGKYSSDKTNQEQYERIKQIEYEHLETKTDHERNEIREIMKTYNFKGKDLDRAVEVITNYEDAWVDLMMRNEFNMTQENLDPVKGGVATFISFVLIGSIPLTGYIFKPFLGLDGDQTFLLTIIATLLALFIVGGVKSRFILKNWITSGIETAAIGGIAALIAFGVGFALKGLVGA